MKLINTDGMAFIGPGSEWFWTAVSGVVLAITFLGIYRQLSIARSANAFEQLNRIENEWDSERSARHRLDVLVALHDGTDPADVPDAAAASVGDLWENVALLARAAPNALSIPRRRVSASTRPSGWPPTSLPRCPHIAWLRSTSGRMDVNALI